MKKSIMIAAGALALMATGTLFADDTMKSSKTTASTTKSKATTTAKVTTSDLPADRTLEIRVGPRASFVTGSVQIGKTGTNVDVWDNLGLDEPNIGTQLDIDYQVFSKFHIEGEFTYDSYDQTGTSGIAIVNDRGDVAQPGAAVAAKADIYTFDAKLGYDVYKSKTIRVRPYIGVVGEYIDANLTASGSVITAAPGSVTRTGSIVASADFGYASFFGGVDSRLNISRNWYVGGDIGAFGLDDWYLLRGDGYTGYDFTKSLGLRVGYDFNYIDYKNASGSTTADPLLGAAYVQVVWGF
jgi:hypothetical protein